MSSLDTSHLILKKRLRPLYVMTFFQGFVLWYAVEKLFMRSIGITDAGIAVVIVVFTLVMMLVNIPTGILADRWSRKGVLVMAVLLLIASTIVDGFSTNFWFYLLGSCLWGISFACYTGTIDSVVYDTVIEETGSATNFELYYGRTKFYDGLALVLSSLASSLVIHYLNLREAYFITAPFGLISLWAILKFTEPKLHKVSAPTLLRAHIKETISAVLRRREIFWLSISLILITILSRIVLEFDQLWLIALSLPLLLYGPVNALLLGGYASSGWVANHINRNRILIIGLALVMIASAIVLLFHTLWAIIIVLFLLLLGGNSLEVLVNRWLHDSLGSNIRAGASSTIVTTGYAIFLPIGLLFGKISNDHTVFMASWLVIPICVLIALSVGLASKRASSP